MTKAIAIIGLVAGLAVAVLAVDFDFSGAGSGSAYLSLNTTSGWLDVWASDIHADMNFHAEGAFSTELWIEGVGSGMFDTDVLASSSSPAFFYFSGSQDLFGYTNNQVAVYAHAEGDTSASMNLRFDNSMYVVQLERHNTGEDFLAGSGDYFLAYGMAIQDRDTFVISASVQVSLSGSGAGSLDTTQWFPAATGSYGWGNPDSIQSPNVPGYYHPYNTADATGVGTFGLILSGSNYVSFNGFELPGGGILDLGGQFFDGFSGSWDAAVVR